MSKIQGIPDYSGDSFPDADLKTGGSHISNISNGIKSVESELDTLYRTSFIDACTNEPDNLHMTVLYDEFSGYHPSLHGGKYYRDTKTIECATQFEIVDPDNNLSIIDPETGEIYTHIVDSDGTRIKSELKISENPGAISIIEEYPQFMDEQLALIKSYKNNAFNKRILKKLVMGRNGMPPQHQYISISDVIFCGIKYISDHRFGNHTELFEQLLELGRLYKKCNITSMLYNADSTNFGFILNRLKCLLTFNLNLVCCDVDAGGLNVFNKLNSEDISEIESLRRKLQTPLLEIVDPATLVFIQQQREFMANLPMEGPGSPGDLLKQHQEYMESLDMACKSKESVSPSDLNSVE
jgi:hypothetical protein